MLRTGEEGLVPRRRIEQATADASLPPTVRDGRRDAPLPRHVIFDGDDTLWVTERLYDDARHEVRPIVEAEGLDGGMWEALERRLDVENVARSGYSKERFPSSCLAAYEFLCREHGQRPHLTVVQRILRAAQSVFSRSAALVPDAEMTLRALKAKGVRLALLTKGDPEIQRNRIADSGLAGLFDHIGIVTEKDANAVRDVIDRMGGKAEAAWMVGNSVRSDVLPALDAGLHAIWIDAPVWEHERHTGEARHERLIRVSQLSDILRIIDP